jgi:hypothetical protein
VQPDQVELIRRDYTANGGWETFLSYEDPQQDILIGLLRLRKCSELSFRPELKGVYTVLPPLILINWGFFSCEPAAINEYLPASSLLHCTRASCIW